MIVINVLLRLPYLETKTFLILIKHISMSGLYDKLHHSHKLNRELEEQTSWAVPLILSCPGSKVKVMCTLLFDVLN